MKGLGITRDPNAPGRVVGLAAVESERTRGDREDPGCESKDWGDGVLSPGKGHKGQKPSWPPAHL